MALLNHTLYLILTLSSFIEFLNPAAHINLPVRLFSAEMSLRCLWGVGEGRSTENLFPLFLLWDNSHSLQGYSFSWMGPRGSTQQGPRGAVTFLLFIRLSVTLLRKRRCPGRRSFLSLRIPRECGVPGFGELLRGAWRTPTISPSYRLLMLPTLGLLQSQVRRSLGSGIHCGNSL